MKKEEGGGYKYSAKREECESKQHQKKKIKIETQEGKGGSNEFKTTALALNQPHLLMFSVSLLFVDFRLFQTLSKDSPRKEHLPSCL